MAEGDESDGTLVNFQPKHAIILNIEPEHLDYYEDLDAIKAVFRQLLEKTAGLTVYCAEDEVAREFCGGRKGSVSYGWSRDMRFQRGHHRAAAGADGLRRFRRRRNDSASSRSAFRAGTTSSTRSRPSRSPRDSAFRSKASRRRSAASAARGGVLRRNSPARSSP